MDVHWYLSKFIYVINPQIIWKLSQCILTNLIIYYLYILIWVEKMQKYPLLAISRPCSTYYLILFKFTQDSYVTVQLFYGTAQCLQKILVKSLSLPKTFKDFLSEISMIFVKESRLDAHRTWKKEKSSLGVSPMAFRQSS